MIKKSRREFVKKAAYIPPVILSLAAAPSYAKSRFPQRGRAQRVC